jgi:hypothetical protein
MNLFRPEPGPVSAHPPSRPPAHSVPVYLAFIVRTDQGPIDFETFMRIGQRFLAAQTLTANSYYPLPFVLVFAGLSALPRAVSMTIWLMAPLAVILLAAEWQPWVLLFSPVFGHFVGGQADVFAVLGLWGFRRNVHGLGGAWLALTLFKPQLALVPVGYAVVTWFLTARRTRTLPRGALQFLAAALLIYLPTFIIMPDWPLRWLSWPRPLFERAMSAAIPRLLLAAGVEPQSPLFWMLLVVAALGLLAIIWRFARKISLAMIVAWGFIVSPFVHDYDLVQLVPVLETPRVRLAAILSSIPGWFVILFLYGNDHAWSAFALIAPTVLAVMLWTRRHEADREEPAAAWLGGDTARRKSRGDAAQA